MEQNVPVNIEDQEQRRAFYDAATPSTSRNDTQGEQNTTKKRFWTRLEHNGPVFPLPYEPLPANVKLKYNGEGVTLSHNAEEVAGYYARKLHRTCVTKDTFNNNFFASWREVMTPTEQQLIQDFSNCCFKAIQEYFIETKNNQKERKLRLKKKNDKKYSYCIIDDKKERIKNYKIEPPDLFCAVGENPLMGTLKKRVTPEDVTINCSSDSKIPDPPSGRNWKAVKHDNTVSWLASWVSNVTGEIKYIILDERSDQKQILERNKYEIARKLHEHIDRIRNCYRADWDADNNEDRQRGVALYFIDLLGLRAGNEREEGGADTVGCCSLKIKHIQLCENNRVAFDFFAKASIEYKNNVTVEEPVYNNLITFIENKMEEDDLFDQLNTRQLNTYLNNQMPNLTAKVFRTYLASTAFERCLNELTYADKIYNEKYNLRKKILEVFKQANMTVALLLNHKQTKRKPKENLPRKTNSTDNNTFKEISTKTSLDKYIDPRIVVSWCKRFDIPIERVYTPALCEKFSWAIHEAGPNFLFC